MNKSWTRRALPAIVGTLLIFSMPRVAPAYSVLTHEAIIDSVWATDLKPLLLKRFPDLSKDQLREAHANAYGGAIIQDMGYYPFGSRLFSDLAHYVRSGDFVEALIRDSQDANEYAFALGALCHYSADNTGHPEAINRSVPILFPKLRQRYGNNVTYAQDPTAHLQTEFGFDVAQVARGHYAPEGYHDFIGFTVSKPLLERAFLETYGIEMKSLFTSLDLALGTFRYSVSSVIPEMTKVAWENNAKAIQSESPGMTRDKFLYRLPRGAYRKEFGGTYQEPGFFAKVLAVVFRVLPKVGPFKGLQIKLPTPEAEKLFKDSFEETVKSYRQLLGQVQGANLHLENRDFDTGKQTSAREYEPADKAYAVLLDKLATHNFENVSPDLRQNILGFYGDASARRPPATKNRADWQKTVNQLGGLRSSGTPAAPSGTP